MKSSTSKCNWIFLSIGSNTENRIKYIEQAISFLSLCEDITITKTSALYETEPWGVKDQNWFINIAAEISTNLTAENLLSKCNLIEEKLGRNRKKEARWGERTIDIDIIFYEKEIINTENLTIPHERMHERAFVLVPMLEIAPDFVHPLFNKTILELYENLENVEDVFLYGTRSLMQ